MEITLLIKYSLLLIGVERVFLFISNLYYYNG
nr:MAG TPA: hypothetical protein [Caudoviricetes sp.]